MILFKKLSFYILLASVLSLTVKGNADNKTNTPRTTTPSYVVEDVPLPPSQYGSKQIDGLCFLPNGNAVATLPSGEVFIYDIKKKTWSLFAEGLHNPLGVEALSESSIVVAHRPEITKITDTDGDGKADLYEALTDQFGMSGNYHEFNFGPVKDSEGNLYFALGTGSNGNGIRRIVRGRYDPRGRPGRMHAPVPYRGWVMKYNMKTDTLIPWSSGHRTPNGLGFDLNGHLFVTDNQGDWVGSSKMFHVKKGNFYGHPTSLTWDPTFKGEPMKTSPKVLNSLRTRASIIFPHGAMARSPTQPLCDNTEGKFGPFYGQILVGEMNPVVGKKSSPGWNLKPGTFSGRILRVMLENVDGQIQGACIPFITRPTLTPGNNRLAFASDGSLWVAQTKHTWAGGEGLQRIVYQGVVPMDVLSMNITQNGFDLTFTKPLDKKVALDKNNYEFVRNWYRYHSAYGSKPYDNTKVKVTQVSLSDNAKTVSVELEELKCYHVHELTLHNFKAQDGSALRQNYMAYTVNRLLSDTPEEPVQYEEKEGR